MKIIFDEKKCVQCVNCVSESEFNGVQYVDGKILIDSSAPEDWNLIAEICPTGALLITQSVNRIKSCGLTCRQQTEYNSDE